MRECLFKHVVYLSVSFFEFGLQRRYFVASAIIYMHPAFAIRLKSARATAVMASMTTGARRAIHAS